MGISIVSSAIWEKHARVHFSKTYKIRRKNKMVARFSVVSGRGKRRGKCENLEKIAFRKRQKSYEIWFIKKSKGKY